MSTLAESLHENVVGDVSNAFGPHDRRWNALALVSGGKDSCHALSLCATLDARVSLLAHVVPSKENADFEEDEDGGWMFQGAAHRAADALSKCVGLPLLRKITSGNADSDLLDVMRAAIRMDPSINACVCGAVFSDYQRFRVERACAQVGLVALAPLWRIPQSLLVRQMEDKGLRATLVKVAGAGLAPMLLGMDLHAPMVKNAMKLAHERYGAHVGGEGGEYETLTLDCEAFRYASLEIVDANMWVEGEKMKVRPTEAIETSIDGGLPKECSRFVKECSGSDCLTKEGKMALLDVIDVRLVFKCNPNEIPSNAEVLNLSAEDLHGSVANLPGLTKLECREPSTRKISSCIGGTTPSSLRTRYASDEMRSFALKLRTRVSSSRLLVQCQVPSTAGVKDGLSSALRSIERYLSDHDLALKDALFVTLYLRNMEEFATANEAYSIYFPAEHPASRACVQVVFPATAVLAIDVLIGQVQGNKVDQSELSEKPSSLGLPAFQHPDLERKVLHIQTISHWAPCCIGPYAQANAVHGMLHIAGQLGLDSPKMSLVSDNPIQQARLAAMHSHSIALVMNSSGRHCMLACIVYITVNARAYLEEIKGEVFDILCCEDVPSEALNKNPDQLESHDEEAIVELYTRREWCPMVTFAIVPALPKNAAVEIQPFCFCPRNIFNAFQDQQLSDDEEIQASRPEAPWYHALSEGNCVTGACRAQWLCSGDKVFLARIACTKTKKYSKDDVVSAVSTVEKEMACVNLRWNDVYCLRVYYDCTWMDESALNTLLEETWLHATKDPLSVLCPIYVPLFGIGMDSVLSDGFLVDISAFVA